MLSDVQTILVPVDGSEQARNAFFEAIDEAKKINAKILLISVIEENEADNDNKSSGRTIEESRKSLLEAYKETASNDYAFNKVDTAVYIGDAKRIIVRLAKEDDSIGLVVMGATGKNAVERFVVGSVTQYVVRYSPTPVMIVR